MISLFENGLSESKIRTEEVFGENGVMSNMFEGYVPREGQLDSIPLVWDSFKENKHVLLEGPCGFGKTFAYLFPSMMECAEKGKRVIIATSGITLQDQLFRKDAPFMRDIIKEYTGRELKIGYLKGRQNYLCNKKIAEIEFEQNNGQVRADIEEYKPLIEFSKWTKTGDKDELDYVPNHSVWSNISSNKDTCEGSQCPFKHECYYYKARGDVQSMQVLITNYHILLANLQTNGKLLGGGFDILVCDEAHELPEIIRDYWEQTISSDIWKNLKKKIRGLNKYGDIVDIEPVAHLIDVCRASLEAYLQKVNLNFSYMKEGDKLLIDSSNNAKLDGWISAKDNFDTLLKYCEDQVLEADDLDCEQIDKECIRGIFSDMAEVCSQTVNNLRKICGGIVDEMEELDNMVRFVEKDTFQSFSIKCKMKKVGELFRSNFINKQNDVSPLSVMLTSATISADNSFAYIKDQLGITDDYRTMEFIGASPFNLTEQELWYLPPNAKEGNKQGFQNRMLQDLLEVCVTCNGGVLGLFTSISSLKSAKEFLYENIPSDLECEIIAQGDMPRKKLIEYFANEVDSVLLGTKSLFTGVDVPGDSLRCVFIDKLPFPNISDPVQKALNEEPGSFFKYSIPSMIIDLKQAVGRGVRSVNDKCVIVVADNRMSTANYKAKIFSSFNYKKTGTRNIVDVEKFIIGCSDREE